MITPSLKQMETAVHSFWYAGEQPCTQEESEILAAFDPKGMQVYKRLLRNDWQEVLESIYPLCWAIIGNNNWSELITRYIKTFPPRHFNLNRLAKNFALYLSEHESQLPPYISELADYEWLELEIMEHPAIVNGEQQSAPSTIEDFIKLTPVPNPTLSIRNYNFDIMEIAQLLENEEDVEFLSSLPVPSVVAAFRPPGRHYCEFMKLGETEAVLLQAVIAAGSDSDTDVGATTYGELAELIISRHPAAAPETTSLQFINMVEYFHQTGVFIKTSVSGQRSGS